MGGLPVGANMESEQSEARAAYFRAASHLGCRPGDNVTAHRQPEDFVVDWWIDRCNHTSIHTDEADLGRPRQVLQEQAAH